MGANSFNKMEIDAIGEIMNISLGASATAVSTLLGAKVNITTPEVEVRSKDEFEFQRMEPAIGVEISYTQGLDGKNIMMFRKDDVRIIVGMLMGQEEPAEGFSLTEIHLSAICEVMNQMMGFLNQSVILIFFPLGKEKEQKQMKNMEVVISE